MDLMAPLSESHQCRSSYSPDHVCERRSEVLNGILCPKGQYYQTDFNVSDSFDGLVEQGRLSTGFLSSSVTADSQPETYQTLIAKSQIFGDTKSVS